MEETRKTAEVGSVRELNLYLEKGWVLLLSYAKQMSDGQQPRFVVGWKQEADPVVPELLDEWELNELDRQRHR